MRIAQNEAHAGLHKSFPCSLQKKLWHHCKLFSMNARRCLIRWTRQYTDRSFFSLKTDHSTPHISGTHSCMKTETKMIVESFCCRVSARLCGPVSHGCRFVKLKSGLYILQGTIQDMMATYCLAVRAQHECPRKFVSSSYFMHFVRLDHDTFIITLLFIASRDHHCILPQE